MIPQALLIQIKEEVICRTDIGLNIEIQDFFRGCEYVDTFSISIIDGKSYKISIKLKNLNMQQAKKVFFDFLDFVEYPAASFYTRTITEEYIGYNLISINEDMKGFYCEIQYS